MCYLPPITRTRVPEIIVFPLRDKAVTVCLQSRQEQFQALKEVR